MKGILSFEREHHLLYLKKKKSPVKKQYDPKTAKPSSTGMLFCSEGEEFKSGKKEDRSCVNTE